MKEAKKWQEEEIALLIYANIEGLPYVEEKLDPYLKVVNAMYTWVNTLGPGNYNEGDDMDFIEELAKDGDLLIAGNLKANLKLVVSKAVFHAENSYEPKV
ncbi:MAG: hypothetical protein HRT61_00280 [Ekhidna sp.]|jgi:hypothetical protein|nr:hypothetical protein [Ekhidna sp.]